MNLRAMRTMVLIPATLALSAMAGCDGGESSLAGRNATVEYRPVGVPGTTAAPGTPGGVIQKQRSGTLRKVTADYVALDEGGNEIWIPRDMVLEIRLEKK